MAFDTRLLSGVGVLAAVTEAGNFARAGEALGLTPSAVSRAVTRLEARLGVRLFERNSRDVRLTEEGERFHAQVMPLLAGLEEAAAEAGGARLGVSGRLRVSLDPWFARTVLAPKFQGFLRRYPMLSLDCMTANDRDEMLAGIDVALRFGPLAGPGLVARKLAETRVVTVASPGYLAARGALTAPEDVARHEVILFRDPLTRLPFPWEFHREGRVVTVPVAGRFVTDDPSVAMAACVAGQGVFQSLEMGLEGYLTRGELVAVLPEWGEEVFPLYAYQASRRHPPAKVRAFLAFVQAECGGLLPGMAGVRRGANDV